MMNNDLAKVLITEEELRRRVEELGAQIAADYVEKEPILAHLEEFNTAIREVCAEEQVTCIETGDLAKEELYEPDGQHFIMDFYPLWFERMAEAAGL